MTNKHLLAAWDLALQIQCHRHQTLLIDTCPECLKPISHRRRTLLTCNCGVDLLSLSSKKTDGEFEALYFVLGLNEHYCASPQTFAASTQAEVVALVLCRRLKLLQDSIKLGYWKKGKHRENEVFMSAEELMKVREVFYNWPSNFFRLLDQYRSAFGDSPIPKLMGRALKKRDLPMQIRAALDQWEPNVNLSLKPGKRTPALIQKGEQELVGIKYVIQATGCTYDTARYWIESGKLGSYVVFRQQNGQQRFQLEKSRVQKAVQISRASSSVYEMAANLGTTSEVLRELIRARVLFAIPYGRASYNVRLHPPEVYALAERILGCARLRSPLHGEQVVFSSAIKRFRRRPIGRTERFLNAVFSGAIPLSKVQRHVSTLDELLIDLAALKQWERDGMQ